MNQYGLKPTGSSAIIDQLSYHYKPQSNKLQYVVDAANDQNSTLGDFKYPSVTKTSATIDYIYDGNGNMISDQNKNISQISYNILNLPSQIWVSGKGTIRYYYDATGNKLQKRTLDNTVSLITPSVTTYIGGAVYLNDTLQFFGTPEGRVRSNADSTGWLYDYFLKDHLGNTRMMITDDYNVSSPILEAYSYYPFGLQQKGIGLEASSVTSNAYKYQGIELEKHFGLETYETQFRGLAPQIGRFNSIDPKASYDISPYASMANNPVRFADPLGDTVRGFSAQSAQRILSAINKTFAGDKGMKSLFTIGKDGKTFNSIGIVAFAKATENLSDDKLALATAYMMAINGSSNQVVAMVTRNQSLGGTISNLLPGNKTGADIDNNMGGGVNIPYGNNGTLSVIVTNSTANIPDFVNSVTGGYSTQNSSAGELISHEMLGHGMGRISNSPTYGHEDAIQMTNMYMRSQASNLYRDGTSHGTQVQLNQTNANSIPQMYRGAVSGALLLHGAIKLIDKIFGN